jgi:Purple acid Phosphatase, N-terminal domain/Divergent InlB B-repeat domain
MTRKPTKGKSGGDETLRRVEQRTCRALERPAEDGAGAAAAAPRAGEYLIKKASMKAGRLFAIYDLLETELESVHLAAGTRFVGVLLLGVLVALGALAGPRPASASVANSWTEYAADPAGTALGWFQSHWVPALQAMLVWGGNSHNPSGDNSVRLFDPVTNGWTYLWPNTDGVNGLQNRDNHASFYVPARGAQGELWVLGGAYNSNGANQWGGRFDLAMRTWSIFTSPSDFASGLIAGPLPTPGVDAGAAWCPDVNTGVWFGGGGAGNAQGYTGLIEPNPSGPEPYRFRAITPVPSPPARWLTVSSMLCIGSTVYLYGGEVQVADSQGNVSTVAFKDLWRFDLITEAWTQLAPGGQGGPDVAMTYDPANHVLIVFGHYDIATGDGGKDLWIFDLASNTWSSKTDTAIADGVCPFPMHGHSGVYAPSVGAHIFHHGFEPCGYGDSSSPPAGADTTPPAISGVQVTGVTPTSVTVSWTTSEAATGQVQYGLTTSYGSTSATTPTGTAHSVTLTGLTAATTYQYRVRATDKGGNIALGANAAFTTAAVPAGSGPAPPPTPGSTTYLLTVTTAGTGSGTTTGAGTYGAGTVVSLTATAGAGSTFAGWSGDADCTDGSVAMTGSKTCTATFTAQAPLPTCTITAGAFTPCALPPVTANAAPFSATFESKDVNWTYDTNLNLLIFGFGDFAATYAGSQSGQNTAYTYNATTNTWALISSYCHGPGKTTPNHPSDKGPFFYDSLRNALWLWNPSPFPNQDGQPCGISGPLGQPTGSIMRSGILRMSRSTGDWTQLSTASTGSAGNGVYDSANDAGLFMEETGACPGMGNGTSMKSVDLTTLTKTTLAENCLTNSPAWSGATGGWIVPQQMYRAIISWDNVARVGYVSSLVRRYNPAGDLVEKAVKLFKYTRSTNTWTALADPPVLASELAQMYDDFSLRTAWDSVNKRVLFPVTYDACSKLQQMLVYNPADNTWQNVPVPFDVRAGTIAFDPSRNVAVLAGSAFCGPIQTNLYLYRWAP